MSKHNKNRPHETRDKFQAKGEQLLDDVDEAATQLGDDVRNDVDNLKARGREARDRHEGQGSQHR